MKLLLGTLLAAVAVPAMTFSSASVSFTELRYELVDLDPNDGITPYVKFTGRSMARVKEAGHCINCKEFGNFTQPASVGSFPNERSAAVSQEGLFASSLSGSFGFAEKDFPDLSPQRYENKSVARYEGATGMPLFRLATHTGQRITGQYTLDAEVDPYRDPSPLLRGLEFGTADVFFNSRFIDGGNVSRAITAQSDWRTANTKPGSFRC